MNGAYQFWNVAQNRFATSHEAQYLRPAPDGQGAEELQLISARFNGVPVEVSENFRDKWVKSLMWIVKWEVQASNDTPF